MKSDVTFAVIPVERPAEPGALSNALAFGWRAVLKFKHVPEQLFDLVMTPLMFTLLFTFVFGGALACSAAIASIYVTLRDRLWKQAAAKGEYLIPKLKELAAKYPQIYKEIIGKGLLIGQHFHDPEVGYKVAAGLFKRGVLVAGTLTSAQTIRIEPPIVITYEQIDEVLNRLEDTLAEVSRQMIKQVSV